MKFLGTLIITMSTLIVTSHAQITQVNTMEEVFSYFTEADSSTLGVFDIDMVLVQTEDPAFQMANMALHRQVAKKVMQELPSEKERNIPYSYDYEISIYSYRCENTRIS